MLIDILIVIFLAVCMFDGWKDGFMRSLTSLVSWVAAVVCGLCFMERAEALLVNVLELDRQLIKHMSAETTDIVLTVLSFAAIVIIAKIAINIIASILKVVNKIPVLGLLNRAAGALLGAGTCIVILWVAVALITPYGNGHLGDVMEKACMDSRIVPALSEYNPLTGII